MPVTRIKNNQVTDAATGNTIVGINAGTKLQPYSITATRIANNLTYGSDLTITGNLTVQGTTTNVDTVNTLIQDPLITLADGQTSGAPTLDIGTIGLRGSQNSAVLAWKESQLGFVTALSNTTVSNTTFNISSYANLQTGNFIAQGTTSLVGNVIGTNTNFTGNITGGNLLTPGLISATSNITGGNITTGGQVSATANITGGNVLTGGLISATSTITSAANVIGGNVTTGGQVSATGNITTAGAFNGATLSLSGNVTSALNVTGNITGGNILSPGFMSSTGNILTSANLLVSGYANVTGNITGSNINTAGQVVAPAVTGQAGLTVSTGTGNLTLSPAGNVVLSSKYINGLNQPVQDNDAASKIYVDNLVTTAISYHAPVTVATIGNLNAATGGTVTYAQPNGVANGVGATLTTTGSFNLIDSGNVQTVGTRILVKDQANAVQNGVYVWSNATVITRSSDTNTYGPASANTLSINDYFFVTGGNLNEGSAFIVSAPAGIITFGTSNIQFAQFSQSQVYEANTAAGLVLNGTTFSAKVDNFTTAFDGGGNISVKVSANLTTPNIGAANGTSLSVTGTVTAASTVGGVITGSTASLSGNVTGGNLLTGGLISATGNITTAAALNGATLSLSGNVTSPLNITGNTTSGNLLTPGLISATATITGGNLATGGTASATGNVTGGNILTGGLVSATGNVTTANLILTSGFIDGPASGRITINGSDRVTDFAVDGNTTANVFYVNATTGTASFGNSTQITNSLVSFNTTTSMVIPRGTQIQRPGTGVTGMMRFNSTTNSLEIYNNTDWIGVGSTIFTVIADEQFSGNGVQTAYTLSSTQTTASCIVSINGVVQIPTLAYSVSGTTLTFTEAPAAGDVIDVREITTTTTLLSLQNVSGNASISVSDTSKTVAIVGDLTVSGNATILGNVAADIIQNGTSRVEIPDANQDIHFDVNGINEVVLIDQFNTRFMSNVVPQANVTYNLGNTTNRWNTVWSSSLTVGSITNASANGVGNIGSSSNYFNTVFAKATSAQYADLAEKYTADAEYAPGTVVVFGGTKEVTISTVASDTRVAGVVSTNPSYRMNDGLQSEHTAMVALTGRVPTSVTGTVRKGDLMVSAGNGVAMASSAPAIGTVIGKALADSNGDAVIEVVVGRV